MAEEQVEVVVHRPSTNYRSWRGLSFKAEEGFRERSSFLCQEAKGNGRVERGGSSLINPPSPLQLKRVFGPGPAQWSQAGSQPAPHRPFNKYRRLLLLVFMSP